MHFLVVVLLLCVLCLYLFKLCYVDWLVVLYIWGVVFKEFVVS